MIEKLIYQSRTTEVDAASVRLIGAYQNSGLGSDTHLTGMFTTLGDGSARLTAAINRLKADSELEQKDEVRDDKVRALFYLVNGLVYHPDPNVKNAALEVEKVMDKYGLSMAGENYSTESSLVTSLLGDLADPTLEPSIAVLPGCTGIIAELRTAQTDFEQTRIAWESEKAKEGMLVNATKIKNEVVSVINDKLVVYLRAMALVDGETYGEFAGTVTQIIEDNNVIVKKRRKRPALAE